MTIDQFISKVNDVILNPLIILMFAVALVVFLWGVFKFIKGADNEDARDLGKQNILWGLIGMFIMVSAFGLINLLLGTFKIDTTPIQQLEKR